MIFAPTPEDIINGQKAKAFDKICKMVSDLESNEPVNEDSLEFVDKATIITKNWKGDVPDYEKMLAEYDRKHPTRFIGTPFPRKFVGIGPQPWPCPKCDAHDVFRHKYPGTGRPDSWTCHECDYQEPVETARKEKRTPN